MNALSTFAHKHFYFRQETGCKVGDFLRLTGESGNGYIGIVLVTLKQKLVAIKADKNSF